MKKINFCAGPAIMPQSVFEQAAQAVINYNNTGLSILEISHRSAIFDEIIVEAQALVQELLQINDDYAVLFLTGGASTQFCTVPYNLLSQTSTAAYIDTGKWSVKAIKEAKLFGNVDIIASSADKQFAYVPTTKAIGNQYAYVHITSNNTIYGTQMHELPKSASPIVADMSSDIFSKPIDGNKYGVIYAGAQKNMGPAGTTLVVIRKDLLGKVPRNIPTMLNYQTHIKSRSLFNTPPVFPIYCCYLTLKWVKQQGLAQLQAKNTAKATLLYNEIDRNSLFTGYAARKDRSHMNVSFVGTNTSLDAEFLQMAESAGCVGLKGHRSLGGFRASIYNAMDISGVETLVQVMQAFEQKYA